MGIIDILKGIEKLAVELLMWIIYIPKTIYKIIKDPNWVMDYVYEELSKEEKFKAYMSPVLLFLGVSVVLFVLLDSGMLTSHAYDQKSNSISDQVQDAVGLLFLGIPLFFALFTEILRNGSLKKDALMQNLYVQCYYLSPVMLSLFVFLIADQFDWEVDGDYINVSESPLYLFILTLIWFVIVQIKYISRELRYNKIISLGIVLTWFIIIGAGFTFYFEFEPKLVNNSIEGEVEDLKLTLPKDDEYRIEVYNFSIIPDTIATNDFVISVEKINSTTISNNEELNLIHNQTSNGIIEGSELRFLFNGVKGDQVQISLNNIVFLDQMKLSLWTKSKTENLLFNDQGYKNDIWAFNQYEDNLTDIFINLPETGKYHLLLTEITNYGEEYRVGYYKNDYYGATQEEFFGNISYNSPFMGKAFDELFTFYSWKFKGNSGDEIQIILEPLSKNDLAFDIFDSKGKSIVPVDKKLAANLIHWVYVIFFGYIIFIGFRAFFKKSKNNTVLNENIGSKLGRILAVIALFISGLAIFLFIFYL